MTGRPTEYKPEYDRQAKTACKLGATDKDLAELFNVSETTINNWKLQYPSFLESLKAKSYSNDRVKESLFNRANGVVVTQEKYDEDGALVEVIKKQMPPDTGACVVWLANRDPENWKKDPGEQKTGDNVAEALNNIADKLPD